MRFEVRPIDLDESPRPGEVPPAYVERLAREKAQARALPGELVLAADTTVVLDEEILGKPAGPEEAESMLGRLSGKVHTVLTGVALFDPAGNALSSAVETSRVRIAGLSAEEVRWYVATGEPLDKAGSYAIQGLGALFVEAVEGNYTNVVGLPLPLTGRLFRELGHELLGFRPPAGAQPP